MKKEFIQNIIFGLVVTLLTIIFAVFFIENDLGKSYASWKKDFSSSGDWYGTLIIPSKNKKMMWEYQPNYKTNIENLPTIETNSLGFRDKKSRKNKKNINSRRISIIGDSITLGYGNAFNETISYILEEKLNRARTAEKIEVWNFGIDGYNTLQVEELLKSKVLQTDPDKVVYIMCLNDFDFEDSSGDKIKFFNPPRSFLYQKFENVYKKYTKQEFHHWHFSKNKKSVFQSILRMNKILKNKDIPFEVVILPAFTRTLISEKFEENDFFKDYYLKDIHLEISKFLTDSKIGVIDMYPVFKETGLAPFDVAHDVWHTTKKGNEIIATSIKREILNGF